MHCPPPHISPCIFPCSSLPAYNRGFTSYTMCNLRQPCYTAVVHNLCVLCYLNMARSEDSLFLSFMPVGPNTPLIHVVDHTRPPMGVYVYSDITDNDAIWAACTTWMSIIRLSSEALFNMASVMIGGPKPEELVPVLASITGPARVLYDRMQVLRHCHCHCSVLLLPATACTASPLPAPPPPHAHCLPSHALLRPNVPLLPCLCMPAACLLPGDAPR